MKRKAGRNGGGIHSPHLVSGSDNEWDRHYERVIMFGYTLLYTVGSTCLATACVALLLQGNANAIPFAIWGLWGFGGALFFVFKYIPHLWAGFKLDLSWFKQNEFYSCTLPVEELQNLLTQAVEQEDYLSAAKIHQIIKKKTND